MIKPYTFTFNLTDHSLLPKPIIGCIEIPPTRIAQANGAVDTLRDILIIADRPLRLILYLFDGDALAEEDSIALFKVDGYLGQAVIVVDTEFGDNYVTYYQSVNIAIHSRSSSIYGYLCAAHKMEDLGERLIIKLTVEGA